MGVRREGLKSTRQKGATAIRSVFGVKKEAGVV